MNLVGSSPPELSLDDVLESVESSVDVTVLESPVPPSVVDVASVEAAVLSVAVSVEASEVLVDASVVSLAELPAVSPDPVASVELASVVDEPGAVVSPGSLVVAPSLTPVAEPELAFEPRPPVSAVSVVGFVLVASLELELEGPETPRSSPKLGSVVRQAEAWISAAHTGTIRRTRQRGAGAGTANANARNQARVVSVYSWRGGRPWARRF